MMNTSTKLIELTNLNVRFGAHQVLRDINLVLRSGEILTLIGPNGAGKSTLIKCIVGLQKIDSGQITRHSSLSVGYAPQKIHIDPILPISVKRFLQTVANPFQFDDIVQEVGISNLLKVSLESLSGGQFQRVLLARALLRKPNLLVLDEPTQGVDLIGQSEIYELIAKVKQNHHCAVLLVSHDLNLVMAKTDQVICLNGHVCCQGHPEQISQDPEFLNLFGEHSKFAFYMHHHDHRHDDIERDTKDDD